MKKVIIEPSKEPNRDVITLTLAGLFHDVGKVRGIDGHVNSSLEILMEIQHGAGRESFLLFDTVRDLVADHHAKGKGEIRSADSPYIGLLNTLRLSDWLASGIREIEEEDDFTPGYRKNTFGILSPFPLEKGKEIQFCSGNIEGEHRGEPEQMFIREVRGIITSEGPIHSLAETLENLYKYLFSYTDDTRDRTIPLPVHLHLTAAIASSLYQNRQFRSWAEEGFRFKGDFTRDFSHVKEPALRVLGIDIHRIQTFISGIRTEEKAIRYIAGRSFLVNILSKVLPAIVALEHGVTPVNVLMSSGGKSFLILPPSLGEEDLRELERKINESLWKNNISLAVSIAWEDVPFYKVVEALERGSNRFLAEAIESVSTKLEEETNYLYLAVKREPWEVEEREGGRCEVCGGPLRGESDKICYICRLSGGTLRNILVGRGVDVGRERIATIRGLNDAYTLYVVNGSGEVVGYTFYIGSSIPKPSYYIQDREGSIASFEDIVKDHGITLIGALKADGDRMGIILSDIIKKSGKKAAARLMAFSKALSVFFERYMPKLAEEGKYAMHLIYAGGDDLFVVGHPLHILNFLEEVYHELEEYKERGLTPGLGYLFEWIGCRGRLLPSVTASLRLFKPKYKFLWMYKDTNNLLDEVKKKSRGLYTGYLGIQEERYWTELAELKGVKAKTNKVMMWVGSQKASALYKFIDLSQKLSEAVIHDSKNKGDGVYIGPRTTRGLTRLVHFVLRRREESDVLWSAYQDIRSAILSSKGMDEFEDRFRKAVLPFALAYLFMRAGVKV